MFHNGADILDNTANGFSPVRGSQQLRLPPQTSAQLNFLNAFGGGGLGSSYNRPSYNPPGNNNNGNNNNIDDVITINNQGPFNNNRDPDVIVGNGGDPRAVSPELLRQAQMLMQEQKLSGLRSGMRVKDANNGGPRIRQCQERFTQLVGDIFIGNEMVPDVIETPPLYPLELTYR